MNQSTMINLKELVLESKKERVALRSSFQDEVEKRMQKDISNFIKRHKIAALVKKSALRGGHTITIPIRRPFKGWFHPTDLFNAVRKGMGLKLENTFRQHVELPVVSESREEYVAGNLFQEGDEVVIKETNEVGTISVCGTNYVIVEGVLGKKRYWLDAIELLEYNEIGTKKYTDYIKGETPG